MGDLDSQTNWPGDGERRDNVSIWPNHDHRPVNTIDEVEVWITPDGLGRAAVVRRDDGLFCIYVHWKLAPSVIAVSNVRVPGDYATNWLEDRTPTAKLYEDVDAEPGTYETIEAARLGIRSLSGFSKATARD